MSTDLHDLFADAYRDAPPSTVDTDLVVRRGRRVRVRRQAVTGTGALLGVGVVVAGSAAFVGTTHHVAPGLVGAGGATSSAPSDIDPGFTGASASAGTITATLAPSPSGATPVDSPPGLVDTSTSPSPWQSGDPTPTPSVTPSNVVIDPSLERKPAGIDAVALPDPAPGFPIRRWKDGVGPTSFGDGSTSYYVATFGLAKTPYADVPGSPGSQVPTGPEITLFVGDFPMPSASGGSIAGNPIVASPSVAGVTGYVTTGSDKGTPTHDLYFSSGAFTVEIHGFGGVTTTELVALGNALTGLR